MDLSIIWRILLNLPHPLELVWLVWLLLLPFQVKVLLHKDATSHRLRKGGELVSFREIMAVGCVGGFILLTFIFAYCCYITFSLAGII